VLQKTFHGFLKIKTFQSGTRSNKKYMNQAGIEKRKGNSLLPNCQNVICFQIILTGI
jgi:hypothetical protein